jgi:hypothetical protein
LEKAALDKKTQVFFVLFNIWVLCTDKLHVRALVLFLIFITCLAYAQDAGNDCVDCESKLEEIIPGGALPTFEENFQAVIDNTRCSDPKNAKLFHWFKDDVDLSGKALEKYYFGEGIQYNDHHYKASQATRDRIKKYFNEEIFERATDVDFSPGEVSFIIYQMPIVYNRLAVLMNIPVRGASNAFKSLVIDTKRVNRLMKEMNITSYEQLKNYMKGIKKGSNKYLNNPMNKDLKKIAMHKRRLKALTSFNRLNGGHYGIKFQSLFKGLGKKMLKSLWKGFVLGLVVEVSLSHGQHPLSDVYSAQGSKKYLQFMNKDPHIICTTFMNFQNNCFDSQVSCKHCSERITSKTYGELTKQEFIELYEGLQKQNGVWGGCGIDGKLMAGLFSYYNVPNSLTKLKETYLTDMIGLLSDIGKEDN